MALDACEVLIIDDDADVREALGWLLRSRDVPSTAYSSFEACLPHLAGKIASDTPLCMLLDIRMEGTSGVQVFTRMVADGVNLKRLPVIFLTGHGDISTAVEVVKQGAFDFFEKPATDNRLVDRVLLALEVSRQELARLMASLSSKERLAGLSDREREVMLHVARGQLNKIIAAELDISMRTVEVHRARVFDKLGVRSAPELALFLTQLGLL